MLFVLLLLPLIGVFPYQRAVNNPNEFVRVFTSMMIVEQRTFSIDQPVSMFGWVNDMARVPGRDGQSHYFMVKAPAIVYLGVPSYLVFSKVVAPLLGKSFPTMSSSQPDRTDWLRMSTWCLRLFTVQLPSLLFLLWFEKYLRDFVSDPVLRYVGVIAAGLGTNYLAYTHIFASHVPYAACAFLAFALIERERRRSRGYARARRWQIALLSGFLTSACVALEYQSLFVAIVLSLFGAAVFWRPTRLLAFALGGLSNVPGVMYFQWKAYNNPFTPGHQMMETASFAAVHRQGLFGIVWPKWDAIKALAADPGFGFFGMSPFMWIGLVAMPVILVSPIGPPTTRRSLRIATVVLVAICAALFGVNAGFIEWRGGWTVGPRYLVPCGPFFAFAATCFLERIAGRSRTRRAIVRGFGGGLALASVLSIGTVGLVYDTLPEAIARPFAQFAIPMARTGHVPHHLGEWLGWESITFWYVCCAALLAAPVASGLLMDRESLRRWIPRAAVFAFALACGLVPALSKPEDGSELFVLHPSVRSFPTFWEPTGRDRVTAMRNEAERYGPRRPCPWYRLADAERALGRTAEATRDEARAQGTPRESCRRLHF